MVWKISLAASVVLNAALALVWFFGASQRPATVAPRMPKSARLGVERKAGAGKLDWNSVDAPDYMEYVRNLREIGCPEETIYDIVVGDVSTLFAMRAKSSAPSARWRYWDPQDGVPTPEEVHNQRLRRALEKEKQDLLVRILGPDALRFAAKYDLWGTADEAERKLAFLPPAKRSQLEETQAKFHRLRQDAAEWDANGALTEAAQIRQAELARTERKSIEVLLGPDELFEYDLRASPTAERLRAELNGFHPGEDEFRDLFAYRRNQEEILAAQTNVRDPAVIADRQDGRQDADAWLRTALGEERFAEYRRSTDLDYQNALRVTNYLGIPEQVAGDVYAVKTANDEAARAATADPSLTSTARQAAFDRLNADAERELTRLLGTDGFDTYRQTNRWWMRGE